MAVLVNEDGTVTLRLEEYNNLLRTLKKLGGEQMFLSLADYSQYETPAARASDPITSHLAAEHMDKSGKRERQRKLVLRYVRKYPGHTSQEYAQISGERYLTRDVFTRRLPELRDRSLVFNGAKTRCSVTKHLAMTWWPALEELEWIDD